ncbi:hypothetical protein KQI63_16975 [bacterium]|nr:hypothetical protein [bacterium]
MRHYHLFPKVLLLPGMLLLFFLIGCAGQQTMQTEEQDYYEVEVTVPSENLRDAPGGNRVGEAKKGQSFSLRMRRGNWCEVKNDSIRAWIWAPSIGQRSVNPMDLREWIGSKASPRSVDELDDIFGPPLNVEPVGSQAVIYDYIDAGSLFGTRQFDRVKVWVDRATRTVARVEIDLPPFSGRRMELLQDMGLPKLKASSTDFDESVYVEKFDGIGFLVMTFVKGNFEQVQRVTAERYSPAMIEKWVSVPEKKVTIEDGYLTLELTMQNQSSTVAFSCPMVELELVQGTRNLGTFTLGPGEVRLAPGETKTFRMPTPVESANINVKQVAARAELIDMLIVPPGGGS